MAVGGGGLTDQSLADDELLFELFNEPYYMNSTQLNDPRLRPE
jgi:hypothetical protein